MLPARFAALLAVLCLGPAAAGAGTLRGQVSVPALATSAHAPANPYPGRAHAMPGMAPAARGLVTDAVVYLEHAPAAAESALAATPRPAARLAQKDQAFVPRVVAIPAGGRVDFPNQDPIYHNVFSFSPPRRFDLGKYPQGASRSVTFPKPGLVKVYCDIHSDMEAFILVTPGHALARPDAAGVFELGPLPPGDYRLKAWHPDFDERTLPVRIPAEGDATVTVEF